MIKSNLTSRLLLALAFMLGFVSSAMSFNPGGTLAGGQQAYYDLNYVGGQAAYVQGGCNGNATCDITVIDSNDITVGSCTSSNIIACTVRWVPSTPGMHRVLIENTSDKTTQYSINTNGVQ
jgi:hypothetical protein